MGLDETLERPTSFRVVFAGLLRALGRACQDIYGHRLVSLAVFGSVGRDRARPDSDIDVLVVASHLPSGHAARMREFDLVEARLERDLQNAATAGVTTRLSPIIRTPEELRGAGLPFVDMVLEARVLFDRDGFFTRYAEGFRKALEAGGARRVLDTATPHWRLRTAADRERPEGGSRDGRG